VAQTVARIGRAERIAQLDILRGLAILLILLMNIAYMADWQVPDYFPPRLGWTAVDKSAWWLHQMLDGSQRGLLELLFGAGVLIMTRTAMTPDGPVAVADLHYRRNLWLAAFGIVHGLVLLWPGDILLSYGCAALLVFPFRVLPVRKLLIVGVAMIAALQGWNVADYLERVDLAAMIGGGHAGPAALKAWSEAVAEVTPADPAMVASASVFPSLPAWVAFMQATWVFVQFTEIGIFWENWAEAFATMLIGMALFKTGILQGKASASTYWWLLLGGYGVGLALRTQSYFVELDFSPQPRIGMVTHSLARLPVTVGHVGAVSLLLTTRLGAALLRPFTATGRMPLTTYMGASIIGGTLFSPVFDLWGRFSFGELAAIAFAIMGVQLAGATLWLKHFGSGPLEWLWKSLAYNRRQPFRRAVAGAEVMS
jgi:uncharacterized protein